MLMLLAGYLIWYSMLLIMIGMRIYMTYPPMPDVEQARMLREVWAEYRLRRTFRMTYGAWRHANPPMPSHFDRIYLANVDFSDDPKWDYWLSELRRFAQ